MWKETSEGILLPVKLTPKASCNEIVGWENANLKIRIAAVPEKGEANAELIKLLSKKLSIPKTDISIVKGETSRQKLVLLKGLDTKALDFLKDP